MSGFDARGQTILVNTAEPAEFDIADLRLSEAETAAIAGALRDVPFSEDDRYYGSIAIRRIGDHDVVFGMGAVDAGFVILVVAIRRPATDAEWKKLVEGVKFASQVRRLLGIWM